MEHNREYTWTVVQTADETPRVKNLYLAPQGERPTFIAGQYLTVKLQGLGPAEGKAYSIASAPHEPHVRIAVKQIGAFSEALRAHRVRETITTTAPYGFFYPEEGDTMPLVFVVGGVGITPCLSVIQALLHSGDQRPIELHYSNQTRNEIAFREELDALARAHPRLHVHYYVTRETAKDDTVTARRMTAADICVQTGKSPDVEYFICGAMDFTKSLWRSLRDVGVPQHRLYTEGFF